MKMEKYKLLCPECLSDNLDELGDGRIKCLDCGHVFEEGEGEDAEEDERQERRENRDETEEREWQDEEDEEEDEDEDFGMAGDLF